MTTFDQEMWQDFVVEARENLEELEPNLLLLEQAPDNTLLLNDCFRNLHSIKGAAGYMGLQRISSLSHAMESLFHKIRTNEIELTPEAMDLIFQGVDLLKRLTEEVAKAQKEESDISNVMDALKGVMQGHGPGDPPLSEKEDSIQTTESPEPQTSIPSNVPIEDQELFSIYAEEMKSLYAELQALLQEEEVAVDAVEKILRDMERVTHYVGMDDLLEKLGLLIKGLAADKASSFIEPEVLQQILFDLRDLLEGVIVVGVQQDSDPEASPMAIKEEDRELYEIFLDFAKEISAPLANVPEHFQRDWVTECQQAIEKLKNSAHYMDYNDVVNLLNEWEERLAEVLSSEGKGDGFHPESLRQMWARLQALLPGLESVPQPEPEQERDFSGDLVQDLDNAIDTLFSGPAQGEPESAQEKATEDPQASPGQGQPLPPSQGPAREPAAQSSTDLSQPQTVRIDLEKVETLLGDVGELVVIKSGLTKITEDTRSLYRAWMDQRLMGARELKPLKDLFIRLGEQVGALERVVRELQDGVMNMRMLPVSHLFNRYPRIVRDLSRKLNKKVELVLAGTDTSLDKRMMEQIADPLLHIVRNAVDHGIEAPDLRVRMGKPATGRLEISALQEGNFVIIRLTDDGRGLDRDGLIRRAVSLGLMGREEAQTLPDEKVWEIIFYPGISTAQGVSETSGRGVGMDVVKKNIERLGGTVRITSEPGRGTSIELRVPLTLAIIQALLVRVGGQNMAIPLSAVQEAIRIVADEISAVEGFEVISLRQRTLPLIRLGRVFRGTGARLDRKKVFVVIVHHGDIEAGLGVDALLGQQEIVIKPLAEYLTDQPGFAGSTVLGDGSIALIVDIPAVLDRARSFVARQRKQMEKMALGLDGTFEQGIHLH